MHFSQATQEITKMFKYEIIKLKRNNKSKDKNEDKFIENLGTQRPQ